MNMQADYRLENFIINTQWSELSPMVQTRMQVCLIDLLAALIVGADSDQFRSGKRMVDNHFSKGEIPVIGAPECYTFFGATTLMGHSSNAYDIDDGHNIIRAHPGTSFIGGLLACSYDKNISLEEFLTTLYIAYEATIRLGIAVLEHYNYNHSSGTFGPFGIAAGFGRLQAMTTGELNNLLSIAEFHGPLVPSRSASYPSMNKDGVPFGAMVGALACLDSISGFEGNLHLLNDERYEYLCDDLGSKHYVMDLYFKPYPCCRWAHAAIDACFELLDRYHVSSDDINHVKVYTFKKATDLSQAIPTTIDEAQYNIAYPVAAAILHRGFTISQVNDFRNQEVHNFMEKLSYEVDAELDKAFPEKRYARVEFYMKNGNVLRSTVHEPKGEAKDRVDLEWIEDKFCRITEGKLTIEQQTDLINLIVSHNRPLRDLIDETNRALLTQSN